MTARGLIYRLLDENQDARVTVEIYENGKSTKCIFDIAEVKYWGGEPYLRIDDWRKDEVNTGN